MILEKSTKTKVTDLATKVKTISEGSLHRLEYILTEMNSINLTMPP